MANTVTTKTLAAHQTHHGTGEMSEMILATRLANGWTESEIAANAKGVKLVGADDNDDAEAARLNAQSARMMAREATKEPVSILAYI